MKLSKRLKTIADMVTTHSVIDVGCDHGLMDIYLVKEKGISCLAADVSSNALSGAKKNIELFGFTSHIPTICTDGLNGISVSSMDTVVLAGMGAKTALSILKDRSDVEHVIISAHTDIELLRRTMLTNGYAIEDEKAILEKDIYYVVIRFGKGKQTLTEIDYEVGPFLKYDPNYLSYFIKKQEKIFKALPLKYTSKKEEIQKKLQNYRSYLK